VEGGGVRVSRQRTEWSRETAPPPPASVGFGISGPFLLWFVVLRLGVWGERWRVEGGGGKSGGWRVQGL